MKRAHFVPAQALLFASAAMVISACGGGGGGGGGNPNPIVSPTPTSSPNNNLGPAANYSCPTSDSTTSAGRAGAQSAVSHLPLRRASSNSLVPNAVAVEYTTPTLTASRSTITQKTASLNASLVRELTFSHIGRSVQILHVNPQNIQATMAALRLLPGVRTVAQMRRASALSVSQPYFTNDPYFTGFQSGNLASPTPGELATPVPTWSSPPYYETSVVPGQWDMHAIGLEHAFAYSQAGNGSSVPVTPGALGSSSVRIAIIDTGQDTAHPELAGKIVYQHCFITSAYTNVQSTSDFTTDPFGHGTDVSGIAAANINNGIGFVGVGGNVALMGYRVFPTFDSSCLLPPSQQDETCDADTADIADAINDAVANGADVINMSLGSCCGADTPPESDAVADAIAANVIVVAASGNDNDGATSGYSPGGTVDNSIDAPGNDPGVIAAGASALADGQPNGAGNSDGTATSPIEYVASYSDYAATNASQSASSWGIVAPGGDAADGGNDSDDLHWIENIWTSTPFAAADASLPTGGCDGDYPTESTNPAQWDCRILIEGTSMATPHVAGAAALILSATGGAGSKYKSPTAMKTLLCETADTLPGAVGQGCGRLNIYRAMATALADPNIP